MSIDMNKFKALVQYICFKCEDPSKLGATKLNKVLWLADVAAYLHFGKPITGETYIKRQFGPVPPNILRAVHDLEREGVLATRIAEMGGYQQRQFFALKEPDISMFSPREISLVDDVIRYVCENHTATSISRASHDDIWQMAEIGEELPYQAFFVSHLGEIDEADVAWALSRLKRAA